MTQSAPSTNATVVIPGSITDFAKALRELIGAFRDVSGLVRDGLNGLEAQRERGAAKALDYLYFSKSGSLGPLDRIAEKRATDDDFAQIDRMLLETEGEIERSVERLVKFRDALREKHGMAQGQELDAVIYGPVGKKYVRELLSQIVARHRDGGATADQLAPMASDARAIIEDLNQALIALHDRIILRPVKS